MKEHREEEDGMGFAGLVGGEDPYTDGWDEAIKAAVKVVEKYGLDRVNGLKDYPASVASAIAHHVRELLHG